MLISSLWRRGRRDGVQSSTVPMGQSQWHHARPTAMVSIRVILPTNMGSIQVRPAIIDAIAASGSRWKKKSLGRKVVPFCRVPRSRYRNSRNTSICAAWRDQRHFLGFFAGLLTFELLSPGAMLSSDTYLFNLYAVQIHRP